MSAQVTEAHRELARRIMFEFTQAGTATASDVRMAAQIIADSEAKACAELRAEAEESKARERAAIASWDEERQRALREGWRVVELRAELALLREWQREVIQNANAHHAERKEAIARAERAEADLAAERARLDWLDQRGYLVDKITHGASTPHPEDYWICTDGYSSGSAKTVRAAIDAAMKEGA